MNKTTTILTTLAAGVALTFGVTGTANAATTTPVKTSTAVVKTPTGYVDAKTLPAPAPLGSKVVAGGGYAKITSPVVPSKPPVPAPLASKVVR